VRPRALHETQVIVTCQKGLRSLAACERLSRAGFESIAWLNGGYEAAEKGIIATSDDQDIRLAGVGGLSGAIGWNPVQQKEGVSTMDGPFGNVIRIVSLSPTHRPPCQLAALGHSRACLHAPLADSVGVRGVDVYQVGFLLAIDGAAVLYEISQASK
jgi:hypothetical protein